MSSAPELTGSQRRYLRGLAHHLDVVVQVGSAGVSGPVIEACRVALEDHELIKVRLEAAPRGERKEVAAGLAEATQAALVQEVGRVIVLYRPRSEEAQRARKKLERITLPR